jgi:hypothetical protein
MRSSSTDYRTPSPSVVFTAQPEPAVLARVSLTYAQPEQRAVEAAALENFCPTFVAVLIIIKATYAIKDLRRVLPLRNFGAYQKAAGIHALRLAGFEI